MRILKRPLVFLLALGVFAASFLAFFPWKLGAEVGWSRVVRLAGEKGFSLGASAVDGEGTFAPKVRLGQVHLRSPLISGEAGEAEGVFLPMESLTSMAPAAAVRLRRVSVNLPVPGEAPLYLATVDARVIFRSARAEVRELKITGEIGAAGEAVLDLQRMYLDGADIVLGGDRVALLEYLRTLLPLNKEKEGVWTLKRGGKSGHGQD